MQELAAYFYQHVFLAYHRYIQTKNNDLMGDNGDRREAVNAATALYHFREHIPEPLRRSRSELAQMCPDYDLLGDIANAAKHDHLTRGSPRVEGAASIYETLVCTRYEDQDGEYDHQEKVVEAQLTDGSTRDVGEILTNALNMWFEELRRLGVDKQWQPNKLLTHQFVPRQEASSVRLQITAGVQWTQRIRFQRYNPKSNSIEPVDLSDAEQVIFTVRKPRTFEVQKGDDSGPQVTEHVALTPEQAKELEQIDEPDQRNQYLWKIALSQGIPERMVAEYLKTRSGGRTS